MTSLKQTIKKRIVTAASRLGSKADTARGAHKYTMAHQSVPLVQEPIHPFLARVGRDYRAKDLYLAKRAAKRLAKQQATVKLGATSIKEVESKQKKEHPRKKNWNPAEATIEHGTGSWVDTRNEGRYSSRCTYQKLSYTPKITSYAILCKDSEIAYHWADKVALLKAPFGYIWAKDYKGIKLVSKSVKGKSYRPYSDDLRAYSAQKIRAKLNALHAAKKDAAVK